MVATNSQSKQNDTDFVSTHPYHFSNQEIADVLEQVSELLEVQGANPFRVRAYWEGAQTLRKHDTSVVDLLLSEGVEGLETLAGIGKSLAGSIEELVYTGRLRSLERLQGEVTPEDLFATIPGIGEELASHIHRELGIETLEELELSAHDGSLERVAGFGHRRVRLVRDALSAMLGRSSRRHARLLEHRDTPQPKPIPTRPPVALLLTVDDRYRRLAEAGKLRTITPRRFNPEGKNWLPIMHWEQGGWTFTVLFSNTARAHQFGKTQDWVVIFYERGGREGQCTVVTETRGSLAGQRVVRGREADCQQVLSN